MKGPLLKITNLSKRYDGNKIALKNITLEIQPKEFVVIIGPSGAGKSTLIRCLNQLVKPSEGEIIFDGEDISKAKGKKLRQLRGKIGMIFQHYNLISRTNVLKNVLNGKLGSVPFWVSTFGLYSQEDRLQAYNLLKTVGLQDSLYQQAKDLSGGQMQRVGICRALMQEPSLILADEPIASLDPKSSEVVMDYLKKVTEERDLTCIVNLHQVEVAKKYATRIIGVREGEIVFDGTSEELSEDIIKNIYHLPEKKQEVILPVPGFVAEGEAVYE
ncbi:phosphonate ABC transporter ATP-binding protein [Vagococcus elongatus]|uniref:Phosphonate ABC transporter ATP-binding protein n=1 Tax=Vagococcus elongatus TaxID=180344 RepID=A0A430B5Z0_9ENTE|nr:phosphonate ABC transporter ATP-binding protein [Vagococcus elongatus]RSU15716.1 phosphonate ABC transporter ATP-binding protein [Vagococcus elongatus]